MKTSLRHSLISSNEKTYSFPGLVKNITEIDRQHIIAIKHFVKRAMKVMGTTSHVSMAEIEAAKTHRMNQA